MIKRIIKETSKLNESNDSEESKPITSRTLSYDGEIQRVHLNACYSQRLQLPTTLFHQQDLPSANSETKVIDIKSETAHKDKIDIITMLIRELNWWQKECEWDNINIKFISEDKEEIN